MPRVLSGRYTVLGVQSQDTCLESVVEILYYIVVLCWFGFCFWQQIGCGV